MHYLLMFFLLPSLFAGALCYASGNATPAIIVGGITFLLGLLSLSTLPNRSTAGGLGFLFIITLPFISNGIILLLGTAIYYIAR